jgi:hypothetical protein
MATEKVGPAEATTGKGKDFEIYCAIGAELLFILLPFVVIAIVFGYRGQRERIISTPEWALAAAVLIGQSVTRLAAGTVGRSDVYTQRVVLAIAVIIVALLAPCLLVLVFVLTSEHVTLSLSLVQLLLFLIGMLVFSFMTHDSATRSR